MAERVKVRIGLAPKELEDNPLQPGVLTVMLINTREVDWPLLSSSVDVIADTH